MCIRDSTPAVRRSKDRAAGLVNGESASPIQLLTCVPMSAPPASIAAIITARAACAVSYTHLDVYKRQSNELYERAMPLAADGELYSWTLYEVLPDGAGGVSLTEYYY